MKKRGISTNKALILGIVIICIGILFILVIQKMKTKDEITNLVFTIPTGWTLYHDNLVSLPEQYSTTSGIAILSKGDEAIIINTWPRNYSEEIPEWIANLEKEGIAYQREKITINNKIYEHISSETQKENKTLKYEGYFLIEENNSAMFGLYSTPENYEINKEIIIKFIESVEF